MAKVQFFLFGLILIWFTASGKLRALWQALQTTPQHASAPVSSATSSPPPTPPVIVGPMPGQLIPMPQTEPIIPIMPV